MTQTMHQPGPALEIENLTVSFPVRRSDGSPAALRAVDGVSLSLGPGGRVGLVGESGSGKSTIARSIVGLITPGSGRIRFDGVQPGAPALRRQIQMVFQDPGSSLNPRLPVWLQVSEPARGCLGIKSRVERRRLAARCLGAVGLDDSILDRMPHAFSGGQRQRIAIARALSVDPALIVADEPMSSLDVSSQAEIAALFERLCGDRSRSLLLISHDLSAVVRLTDHVVVLYLGAIMESGPTASVLRSSAHPYTQALLDAAPRITSGSGRRRLVLAGDPPSPVDPPAGCPFHPRCPRAAEICNRDRPVLRGFAHDHLIACHFPGPDPEIP